MSRARREVSKDIESDVSSELSEADEDVDIEAEDEEGSSEAENTIQPDSDDEGQVSEENVGIEDLDDIDEDLELREEEEEEEEEEDDDDLSQPDNKLTIKASTRRGATNSVRETRKRQLTYYEEDDDEDDEDDEDEVEVTHKPRSRRAPVPQPQDLDADLILTDEEQEYNPHANPDVSKMTERQRARYMEEENSEGLLALGESLKDVKKKSKTKETDEEAKLRKAESTRRRQDYKNKQDEEEKRDTLNKLLKRRATKTRAVEDKEGPGDAKSLLKPRRPVLEHPALIRYVTNTTNLNGNATLLINTD